MPTILIGHEGLYNLYSTISDSPYFEGGLTEEELREYYLYEYGVSSKDRFEERLLRCKTKGTSSERDKDLEGAICCNRAGENEGCVPYGEFIELYLKRKGEG